MTKESESHDTRSEVVIRSEDLQKEGHPKGNALSLFSTDNIQKAINQAIEYKIQELVRRETGITLPETSGFRMARRV